VDEGGHAAHREPHPRGGAREGREQRDRLEAWLGEQAVADPQRVEGAGGLGLLRKLDESRAWIAPSTTARLARMSPKEARGMDGLPAAILAAGPRHVKGVADLTWRRHLGYGLPGGADR
jgi:hypothetical protein